MALTERYEEDQINIVGKYKQLQVRTSRVIYDDVTGEERATGEDHYEVLHPNDNVSNRSTLIRNVANALWTPEIKQAWANRPKSEPEAP